MCVALSYSSEDFLTCGYPINARCWMLRGRSTQVLMFGDQGSAIYARLGRCRRKSLNLEGVGSPLLQYIRVAVFLVLDTDRL